MTLHNDGAPQSRIDALFYESYANYVNNKLSPEQSKAAINDLVTFTEKYSSAYFSAQYQTKQGKELLEKLTHILEDNTVQ